MVTLDTRLVLRADLPFGVVAPFQAKLVELLAEWNAECLLRYSYPPLYASGVEYRSEASKDVWKDVRAVYLDGYGDCEDLAAWRLAELWLGNTPARAVVTATSDGSRLTHILIELDGGRLEDPSKILKG